MGPQRSRTLNVTLAVALLCAIPLLMVLMVSTAPAVSAAFAGGSGTAGNPYQIADVTQLQSVKDYPMTGVYYILINDIDATVTSGWNGGAGFVPIGTYAATFKNSFDGRGYKIINLRINRGTTNAVGLFAAIGSGGVVKNVGLTNVYAKGQSSVGGLVGINYGRVDNCYSTGSVNNTSSYLGGLVGQNYDGTVTNSYSSCSLSTTATSIQVGGLVGQSIRISSDATISNCYSTGSLTGSIYNYVGGLVGHNAQGAAIYNSYSTKSIIGNSASVGGLVGSNTGPVDNCYSTGSVSSTYNTAIVGGLIGTNGSYGGRVTNSYSTGSATGKKYVGGLIGTNGGTVLNCYSTGAVSGDDYVGGLIGRNTNETVGSCYSKSSVTGINYVGGLIGTNTVSVIKCYSTGVVSGSGSDVGGLVGANTGIVDNSFWNTENSGQGASAGGTGKTTAEMQDVRTFTDNTWSAGLTSPWDFVGDPYYDVGVNDNWIIRSTINNGYPFLTMQLQLGLLKITIVSPADGTKTTDNTPTFEWDNTLSISYGGTSFYPDNYEICVDNDSDFSSPAFLENVVDNKRTIPDANQLVDENYRWRVRAYMGHRLFGVSDNYWTFIVDTRGPIAPSLSSPGNNSVTEQLTLTFQWSSASDDTSATTDASGVKEYELLIDNNSDFTSPEIWENHLNNTSKAETLAGGLYSYYWKVRAWDWVGNYGAWSSPTWKFVIENFALSTSAPNQTIMILKGSSGSITISVQLTLGVPSTVSLEADEWIGGITPSGITTSFDNVSGTMPFNSALTFTVSSSADTGGPFTCRITATSDNGTVRTLDITVYVTTMVFSVSRTPSAITLMRSDNATVSITVKHEGGIHENVFLSGSWVGSTPLGVSWSFTKTYDEPDFSSVLSFGTTDTATTGSFTYQVKGTSDGGAAMTVDVTVNVSTTLTITVTTDKDNYEKGKRITISGTAKNPKNESVGSGTATISIVSGSFSKAFTSTITNGAYLYNYNITFDNPEGTWTISVTAVDDYGNATSAPVSVEVIVTKPSSPFYGITFLDPTVSQSFSRSETVTVTVQITENDTDIKASGVNAVLTTSRGDSVLLVEDLPGIYSVAYTIQLDTPTGNLTLSILGEKTVGGVLMAGGASTTISILQATLDLTLISPIGQKFEAGQTVEVKVQARYSDGSPVEGIIVVNTPGGENLVLTATGSGFYSANYTIGEGETGTWNIQISAVDAYGNSNSVDGGSTVIVPPGISSYIIRYWPVVLAAVLGLGVASAFVAQGRLRTRRLGLIKREKQEIERLRKEAAMEYFKKGAIPRETYDNLTKEYETKLTNLDKEERILTDKMKKKKSPEKKHQKKKGK